MKAHDPKTMRECSVPKTPEAANGDWQAFCEAVYAARVKHRIPDVVLVARLEIDYPDDPGIMMADFVMGDSCHAENMAAWLLGRMSAARQEMVARCIKQAGGVKNAPPRE